MSKPPAAVEIRCGVHQGRRPCRRLLARIYTPPLWERRTGESVLPGVLVVHDRRDDRDPDHAGRPDYVNLRPPPAEAIEDRDRFGRVLEYPTAKAIVFPPCSRHPGGVPLGRGAGSAAQLTWLRLPVADVLGELGEHRRAGKVQEVVVRAEGSVARRCDSGTVASDE